MSVSVHNIGDLVNNVVHFIQRREIRRSTEHHRVPVRTASWMTKDPTPAPPYSCQGADQLDQIKCCLLRSDRTQPSRGTAARCGTSICKMIGHLSIENKQFSGAIHIICAFSIEFQKVGIHIASCSTERCRRSILRRQSHHTSLVALPFRTRLVQSTGPSCHLGSSACRQRCRPRLPDRCL